MTHNNDKTKDDKILFSIGEMAKLFGINIRTLRYYDEIGILKPEYINKETNYRYYSTNQFERLNTIKYLRALGVPLKKIIAFFDEKEVKTILSIFEEQRETVKKKQEELIQIQKKITNRIEQIKTALSASYGEVVVKFFPQREIVLLEQNFTTADDLEPLIRDLSKAHCLNDAIFLGKVGISINKENLIQEKFTYFSSVFIVLEEEDDFINKAHMLPESDYVTVQYRGTHEDASPYYRLLLNYIKASGFQVSGDSVEITIIDTGLTNDRNKFVTELQIPFQQREC